MGINVHCLDCSGTYIVVLLLETDVFLAPLTRRQENSVSNSKTTIYVPEQVSGARKTSVSNSKTTIYVPEQSKQCTFIP